jgi:hypothetical protein
MQQRSGFASLWSLMLLPGNLCLISVRSLHTHTFVCLLVPLICDWLPHTTAPAWGWDVSSDRLIGLQVVTH